VQRARKIAVAVSSAEAMGATSAYEMILYGKKIRPMIAGMFEQASMAKAVWIIEGMIGLRTGEIGGQRIEGVRTTDNNNQISAAVANAKWGPVVVLT